MCIPGGPGRLRYTAERPRRPRASYAMPSAQHMFAFTHLALSNNQLTGGQNTYLAARLFWLMSFLNAIDSINRFYFVIVSAVVKIVFQKCIELVQHVDPRMFDSRNGVSIFGLLGPLNCPCSTELK